MLARSYLRISNEQVVESESKARLLLGFISPAGCLQFVPLQEVHVLSAFYLPLTPSGMFVLDGV